MTTPRVSISGPPPPSRRRSSRRRGSPPAHVGQILHGTVIKVVPFGVFVRVADGVEGLIHLSELTAPTAEASGDEVRAGDEVSVIIIEIDTLRRRLALSRR
ncbi:S1 RNA-binding domain-containing protein [Nonomuraea sp. NPDC051941]|uniref:S1 RNA-binding domain-containing protein n=1 Tax=Nonomuraea sp. NPDC051941 TaxID=3364373 RepID=UPI0037C93298